MLCMCAANCQTGFAWLLVAFTFGLAVSNDDPVASPCSPKTWKAAAV